MRFGCLIGHQNCSERPAIKRAQGYGAGACAGGGAGQHKGNRNTMTNRNQGSKVIDGKSVRNQTIIYRSNNRAPFPRKCGATFKILLAYF